MKTFKYKLGHVAGQTMTVAELKNKLNDFPDTMPVFAQWEGCNGYIEPENFEVEVVSKGQDEDKCDCLIIDVNHY